MAKLKSTAASSMPPEGLTDPLELKSIQFEVQDHPQAASLAFCRSVVHTAIFTSKLYGDVNQLWDRVNRLWPGHKSLPTHKLLSTYVETLMNECDVLDDVARNVMLPGYLRSTAHSQSTLLHDLASILCNLCAIDVSCRKRLKEVLGESLSPEAHVDRLFIDSFQMRVHRIVNLVLHMFDERMKWYSVVPDSPGFRKLAGAPAHVLALAMFCDFILVEMLPFVNADMTLYEKREAEYHVSNVDDLD
jgi:hypothetical protein